MSKTDAEIVACFIVDWWPGLEDGLSWPDDADYPEKNPVYAAATRILKGKKRMENWAWLRMEGKHEWGKK